MRLLRYVGPGDDAAHITVEDAFGTEQFALLVDDALRADVHPLGPPATATAAPTAPTVLKPAPASGPPLTPREIQVRVRAGEAPEQLAAQAGVSPDRISRFAYAVLQERLRVSAEARRGRARHGGAEGPLLTFGDVVDARFEEHGISRTDVTWDAVRDGDAPWTVIARWMGGGVERSARWSFLLSARTLVPEDDTAQELLSDRPVQRHHGAGSLTMVPPPPSAPDDAAEDNAAGDNAAGDNVRRLPPRPDDQFYDQEAPDDRQRPALEPSSGGGAAAFNGLHAVPGQNTRSAPAEAAAPPPPAAPAAAPPAVSAPQLGAFFDSAPGLEQHTEPTLPLQIEPGLLPFDVPASHRTGAPSGATPEDGASPGQRPLIEADELIEVHELPRRPEAETAADGEGSESDRAARARIPSWDDILLGVRRKRD